MQLPTSRRDLLHAPGYVREGKRLFIVFGLEIDPSFRELNFFQSVHGSSRRDRAMSAHVLLGIDFCRRQPSLKIPAAFGISHQNQTRLVERHGAKFKMASQQTHPAKIGGQMFCTKEVLAAECGVFAYDDVLGVQAQAGQNTRVEARHFHRPSKGSFQMFDEIDVYTVGPREERVRDLQDDDKRYDGQRWFPPLLQSVHAARKFRRLMRKKVGADRIPRTKRRYRPEMVSLLGLDS